MPRTLDRVLCSYRIGDPHGKYPIYDATGSTISPGRWNTTTSPMIYTSEHYSTALLEKLVHGSGMLPHDQHYMEITIPNGVSYEVVTPHTLPGWDDASCGISRQFGEAWRIAGRSLLLFVPSVVARTDMNILINPDHPDFPRITHGIEMPVPWDARLFSSPAAFSSPHSRSTKRPH
jgi:RES domain-containing protein